MMKAQNVTPTRATYGVVLSALGESKQVDRALELFQEMRSYGINPTPYEYITLISACGREGRCETAFSLLKEVVGMSSGRREALDGVVEKGSGGGIDHLAGCYKEMLKVFGKAGRWKEARLLLGKKGTVLYD